MKCQYPSPFSVLRGSPKISKSTGMMEIKSDFGKNLYIHSVVVPSVNVDSSYRVSEASAPFVNFRGDCIPTQIAEANKDSLLGVPLFIEHAQIPGTEQGQIRDIQWYKIPCDSSGEEVLVVDGLLEVPWTKSETIQAIKDGYFKSVSQSCLAERSVCSKCGHISFEVDDFCDHVKKEILSYFPDDDGKMRIVANVLGDLENPQDSIVFIETSFVANPAFYIANFKEVYNLEDVFSYLKSKDSYSTFREWDPSFLVEACSTVDSFGDFNSLLMAVDPDLARDTLVSSHIFHSSFQEAQK